MKAVRNCCGESPFKHSHLSASGFLSFSQAFSYKAKNSLAVKAINNGVNCVVGFGVTLTV